MNIDLAYLASAAALARWRGWRTLTIGRNEAGYIVVLIDNGRHPSAAQYRAARRENET